MREALRLDKKDIDFENKEIKIENIKTHLIQSVYFTDRSLGWLRMYWEYRKDNLEPAFISTSGSRLIPQTVRKTFYFYLKPLGIKKKIRPHIFRKTLCTRLLQGGVDIKSTQNIMRHNSERTTLRYYAAVDMEKCKSLHAKIMANIS